MDMKMALSKYHVLGEEGVGLFKAELQSLNKKAEEEVCEQKLQLCSLTPLEGDHPPDCSPGQYPEWSNVPTCGPQGAPGDSSQC